MNTAAMEISKKASASPGHYADLAGKTVLVTGSSKALGAESARAFAAQSAKVIVHGRDPNAVAQRISLGLLALALVALLARCV